MKIVHKKVVAIIDALFNEINHARLQLGFMYKIAAVTNSIMMYVTTKLT